MSLFALNLDILDCILALVDPYDASCLSLTCREAQKIAIPRVLERVEFPLPWVWRYRSKRPLVASWNLYNSFAVYTLADAPQRLWCLRDLILGENTFCVSFSDPMDLTRPPRFDFTLVGPLIDVIHGAVQLRRLSIERSEDLFSCVPLLTDAIASLPRLQEVRFRQADTITLSLLSRLKSRPHTVEVRLQQYINWETNHQCWGQYVAGKHRFLNNFTESLEVLELDGGSAVIKALEPHTVWSTVRELTLNRGESANLYVLANAFPNLRRLHVEPPPTKHVPPSDRWQELDFVHSQNPLPLQHPVRHIEIDWFLKPLQAVTPYEQAETAATIAMLQKTQPIVLQCHAGKHVYSCIAQHAPSVRFLQVIAAPEWRPPFTSFAIHKVTDEKATAVLVSSPSPTIVAHLLIYPCVDRGVLDSPLGATRGHCCRV